MWQPLVRSWKRYQTRFFAYRQPIADPAPAEGKRQRLPWTGRRTIAYWSEKGCERLQLLSCVVLYLNEHRWGKTLDTGWDDWDVEIYCHPWTVVQVWHVTLVAALVLALTGALRGWHWALRLALHAAWIVSLCLLGVNKMAGG